VQVCIICSAGFASYRCLQVSSNVRPHTETHRLLPAESAALRAVNFSSHKAAKPPAHVVGARLDRKARAAGKTIHSAASAPEGAKKQARSAYPALGMMEKIKSKAGCVGPAAIAAHVAAAPRGEVRNALLRESWASLGSFHCEPCMAASGVVKPLAPLPVRPNPILSA
jgi:hypothetical protein